MHVSVAYSDEEPHEILKLKNEPGVSVKSPKNAPWRARSEPDRLLKEAKKKAEQEELEEFKLGDVEFANVLHFKYLGVMQSSDDDRKPSNHDSLVQACRPQTASDCLKATKRSPPPPFKCISNICASLWMRVMKIVSAGPTQARRCSFKDLSRITGRSIADEARESMLDAVMRARDRRWNWLGYILRLPYVEEHRVIRQVLMNGAGNTSRDKSSKGESGVEEK